MAKKAKEEIVSPATEAADMNDTKDTKAEKAMESRDFSALLKQVKAEYTMAKLFMQPKQAEWAVRLKLYNNQKRDKEAIGDPLLFTIHQTVLASLYDDRLASSFAARESGDEEKSEVQDNLAEFDYDEMQKERIDYEWDWDASFFGRGLLLNMEFDRDAKCPMPEVIDPMVWLRDPRAKSVNGDRKGRGAMKFGGREIRISKDEMEKAGIYFNYENLKPDTTDINSLMAANEQARADAQGLNLVTQLWKENDSTSSDCRLVEWFTIEKGKKILVTFTPDAKQVVRYTEIKTKYWPIVDRTLYPIAHDWDGVSIPDLVEDKQRARAVVQNLGLAGIKVGLHPTYLYNSLKIKNRGNLKVDFNKHIPIEGDPSGAIQEVQRSNVKTEVNWIMDILDSAAQKATATPDIQQGANSSAKRTATELNLVSSKVDTRYSLSAKIWGWSEKVFWEQWYDLYDAHFHDGIDEKIIRISGAMGARWQTITRNDIIGSVSPDIKIESKIVSEAKKINDLQKYRLFLKDIMATDPQSSNIRLALRKIGNLSGFKKDEIDQILPPTVDELTANEENLKLDAKQKVAVNVYDDDFMHMVVHNKAADTPQKYAHINAHKQAMMLKRAQPQFNMAAQQNRPGSPVAAANTGAPMQQPSPSMGMTA